ncbi:hypothetical protein ALQ04_05441 [Pseudomonas cichorii]|uniref:Uncharacterized protein n=1 Tax=Pseudomonas cichorii TaxID=36746 RepID=A0A3M4LMF9_PSECI|nr:hypothetical protein ALQ04_05441 [Pseudomonas cichorii]
MSNDRALIADAAQAAFFDQGMNDPVLILTLQAGVDGQAQHPLAQGPRYRLPRLWLKIFEGVQRRVEVATRIDAPRIERGADSEQVLFVLQAHREVAVVQFAVGFGLLQVQIAFQTRSVAMGNFGALFENVLDIVQNAQPHGGREFVELGVDADAVDLVDVGDAEVAQQVGAPCQFVIIGNDRAAFDGVKQLGRMKAQGADIAAIEHGLASMSHRKCMGAVVDHLEPVLACDLLDCVDRTRIAEHMGAHDGAGVFADAAFDVLWRDIPGLRIDIGKDWPDTFPLQGTGGRYKAERRSHGAAAKTQGAIGYLQGQRAVVGQDNVLDPQIVLEPAFQLAYQWSVIGQPASRVNTLDIRLELVDITKVRLGYVNHRSLHVCRRVVLLRVSGCLLRESGRGRFRRRYAGPGTDTCGPALIDAKDHAGCRTAAVRVTEMQDGRGAFQARTAGLVGVQGAVAPEQVDIAGLQLQYLGGDPAALDGDTGHPATEAVLQQCFLDDIAQHTAAQLAGIGKQHQIAAFLAVERDVDRNQSGDQAGIEVEAIGFAHALRTLDATQHREYLLAGAVLPGRVPIQTGHQLFECRIRPEAGQQTFSQCTFTVIREVFTGMLLCAAIGKCP